MNSILEQALVHLLNEEHEKAEELLHQFVVDRARSIHESLRSDDEEALDMSELEEELFTEADLEDEEAVENLTDDGAEADFDLAGAEDFGAEAPVADEAMDAEDEACEAGDEACVEDKLEDLEAQLAELTAEFEQVMAEFESAEGEEEEVVSDEADFAPEADAEVEAGEEEEEELVRESEDFDDITESVVDDLKKIAAPNVEGKGATGQALGGGAKVSTLDGKKADAKVIVRKSADHKGFDREAAPKVGQLKKADNVRAKAEAGTAKVTGPNKKAELSKPVAGNTKSNIPGGNPKAVK